MHRFNLPGAYALAGCLLAFPAVAQQTAPKPPSPPPATVSGVVVTARSGSLTQPGVAQEKATMQSIAGSVGFIDAQSFQGRYADTLRDVLKDAPGLFVQSRYGQELRLSVRGSGIARGYHLRGIEVLQDGVPWNLADGSGDFYEIDPLALRTIEIFKGGNGLQYGASTLGGAINLVTPTALTALAPGLLRLEGGSFGTVRASAMASHAWADWDGLVTVTGNHSNGSRQHDRSEDVYLNGNVGHRLSDRVETRLYISLSDTRQQLPGSLTLAQALNHPRQANPTASTLNTGGNQQRNQTSERLADRTTIQVDGGQIDIDLWADHKHLDHPIFQVIYQDGWTWGGDARLTRTADLGGLKDELIAGVRVIGGDNRAQQFVNLAGRRGALTADARQNATDVESYAEDRLYLTPTLALMAGGKYLADSRRLDDLRNPANSAEQTYDGFNPKVGLLWRATPKVQVFADLTESRDVPDFGDLVQSPLPRFVPLKAQRAWTGETGVRGELGPLQLDFTAYRAQIRGELLQFTVDPNVPASTFNAGSTVHQGIEASARLTVAENLTGATTRDRLSVFGLWNLNDFRFRHDPQYGDNRIAGSPPDVLRAELRYERASGFYVAPQLDWVPRGAWADQANTLRAPGYALVGAEAGVKLRPELLLFMEARNLTDRRYVSDISTVRDARAVSTAIFYPGEGRSLYAGLRYAY